MKTLVIIPSRLSAQRLPGKPLMKIKGLSIISHVFKKAEEANIGEVIVAAEDEEIVDDVKQNGGQAILTKNEHKTGTDRIYEVFQKLNSADIDFVMNLQGDEPLMDIDDIKNLNIQMIKNQSELGTLASKIQFRTDKIAALSYFIGGNSNFDEDNGFAIKGWHQIRWENVGINIIDDIALCMGNYFFSLKGEEDLKVEFSLVVRKVNGNLKIILHDSHLPYQQQ